MPTKEIYKRDRDYYVAYNKKCVTRGQLMLHELKENGCAICGYARCDDALSFHHVNRRDKKFQIDTPCMMRLDSSIVDEVNKCILLCENCHREIHQRERNGGRLNEISK